MKSILGFRLRKKKEEKAHCKEAAAALDSFIQNFYLGELLSEAEAKRNLELGLVEILENERHTSNGLLLTSDGYFLTPKHCVDSGIKKMKIRLHDNSLYPMKKVCAWGKKYLDVALVKAGVPDECQPIRYKLYNTASLESERAVILTRRYGKSIVKPTSLYKEATLAFNKLGRITTSLDNEVVSLKERLFLENYTSCEGDSGGVVVSLDGRIMGIYTGALAGEKFKLDTGVKLIEALELVSVYCEHLKKKLAD